VIARPFYYNHIHPFYYFNSIFPLILMEEQRNLLKSTLEKMAGISLHEDVAALAEKMKRNEMESRKAGEVLYDSINLLNRKNKQIKTEIQQLQISQSKNNESFNKKGVKD
jgi:hypothetical protein